jgi:hypothetical protein
VTGTRHLALAAALLAGVAVPVATLPRGDRTPADLSGYDAAVLADGPLFYWPLDETAGPVRDLVGHAAPSTVADATLSVPGASGTAASFDGLRQRIRIPYASGMRLSGSFTVELWAKLPVDPQVSGWPTIFSAGDVLAGHFGLAMWMSTDANHRVYAKRDGVDLGTHRGLLTTAYRHLAFVWDSAATRWTWYVDGTVDTTGLLDGFTGADPQPAPFVIGAMQLGATGSPFSFGRLLVDALAVYATALPRGRIGAHYVAGGGVLPQPFIGGVAVGGTQPWNPRRAADYQAVAAANARWIRSDLGWKYLEPAPGRWRFRLFDPVVTDARAAGLRFLAVLHTVPGWANRDAGDYAPPDDTALENRYCYRTARHYIPFGVTDYEIGNEVNLFHPGWPAPDGAAYTRMFLAPCASGVRRAARELGAGVSVLFGALAPDGGSGGTDPIAFLARAYAAGARGRFDALAWHPYTSADAPETAPQMNAAPERLARIMARAGDGGKKVWATEYGQATGGPAAVSEQDQSTLVAQALRVWYTKPFAGPLFWYSARDTGTSPTDREQHFGLLRYDGSAKPAYAVLAALLVR